MKLVFYSLVCKVVIIKWLEWIHDKFEFQPLPHLRRRGLLRVRDRPHQVGVGGAAGEDLPAVLQVSLMEFPLSADVIYGVTS